MENKKVELKGDALVNKVTLIIIEIINTALILGYLSDFASGNAAVPYFVTFEVAAISSFFVLPVVYKKNPDKLKYIAFICFATVYAIGTLGARTDVTFVMAFPIVVLFILYYDYKLILTMAVTFGLISVCDVAVIGLFLKHLHSGAPINSSVLLMEFLGIMVFLYGVCRVTKISIQNNSEKINQIQSVAEKVNVSIKNINGELDQLNDSSMTVKRAMTEINSGVTNTAEAIQNQITQTEEIQNKIDYVQETAEHISDNMNTTIDAVKVGNQDVTNLVNQADKSVEISSKVSTDLEQLKDKIEAMSTITKMIENIAFQTNIMALNANVEAAHAGEAGRGFAVVAQEISEMSNKTKIATDDITELIVNAVDSLNELVTSIEEMNDVILQEKEQTMKTSEIFTSIQDNSISVQEKVDSFMGFMQALSEANRGIVDSVQTISAVTQQVTALTNEAMNLEERNADAVDSISKQMQALA